MSPHILSVLPTDRRRVFSAGGGGGVEPLCVAGSVLREGAAGGVVLAVGFVHDRWQRCGDHYTVEYMMRALELPSADEEVLEVAVENTPVAVLLCRCPPDEQAAAAGGGEDLIAVRVSSPFGGVRFPRAAQLAGDPNQHTSMAVLYELV